MYLNFGSVLMKSIKLKTITAILLVTSFIALLNQTVMITALPVISHDFGISLSLTQWLTSGYVLMVGLITPISARIYEKYSSRRVFIGILLTLILGTLIGALATNFYGLLLARLIQALASGILMTFMQISLVSLSPANRRGQVMGLVSLVVSAGPALGPSLSGIILQVFPWQALFDFILPMLIILLILALIYLPNYAEPQPTKIDIWSVLSSMLGMGALLVGISLLMTQLLLGIVLTLVGLTALLFFTRRQLKLAKPLLQLHLLKKTSFWVMLVIVMLAFGIMMGTESLLPVYFETIKGSSTLIAGLILLPGALANALVAPIAGKFYDQHGLALPLLAGVSLLLISNLPLVVITATTNTGLIVLTYVIRMIGISLIVSVTITEGLKDLAPQEISDGTALNNALRQIMGSAFTTVMMTIASFQKSFVFGLRLSIWFTVIATMIIVILSGYYLWRGGRLHEN